MTFSGNHRVTIRRPVGEVFAYVGDPSKMEEWEDGILESRLTSDGAVGVGTTGRVVRRVAGMRIEAPFEVVRYEPPERLQMRTTGGGMSVLGEFVLQPAADGATELAVSYTATPQRRPLQLMEPLMSRMVGRQFDHGLQRLKQILETQRDAPAETASGSS
jgi:uncharacterized protein YndB with AHSA1/START domain